MHEEAHDRAHVALVHREPGAAVVERGAHAPELLEDLAAVFLEPRPDSLLERLAADLPPRRPFRDQRLLDDALRRDAGMVVPRLEQGVEPLHPLQPDQRVAERELQRVPGVQLAGHVRGRVRVDERGPRRIRVRVDVGEASRSP